jgi:hypothetical protein
MMQLSSLNFFFYTFCIALVFGALLAIIARFYVKSSQPSLWIVLGAFIGSFGALMICILLPGTPYTMALWLVGGQDVFGSALFAYVIVINAIIIIGSILGGLLGLSFWLKSFK